MRCYLRCYLGILYIRYTYNITFINIKYIHIYTMVTYLRSDICLEYSLCFKNRNLNYYILFYNLSQIYRNYSNKYEIYCGYGS